MKNIFKHIITLALVFTALVVITPTVHAQISDPVQLSLNDYMISSGTNSWYTKINTAITTITQMIDSLEAHRQRIFNDLVVAAGGADSLRILPVLGSNKSSGGRLTLTSMIGDTLKTNRDLFVGTDGIGRIQIGPNTQISGGAGNGTTMTFDGSWSDLQIRSQQDHGAGIWTTNSYPFIAGSNLGAPDAEKSGVKALLMSPAYRAALYTQVWLSKFNVGGSIRSSDSLIGTGVYTTIAKADSSIRRVSFVDSTGWSARDSVMWNKYEVWAADDGPITKGYSAPLKTATVKFRIKYVCNFGHKKRFTLRSDSTNGCIITNVIMNIRTARNLTNPYIQGGFSTTEVGWYANTIPTGTSFSTTSVTWVDPRPTGSLNYSPVWLGNGDGNNDLIEAWLEVQISMLPTQNSTWYVTPSIE